MGFSVSIESDRQKIPNGAEIYDIQQKDDGNIKVRYSYTNKPIFKSDFARIGSFLLAYGRRDIINKVQPFIDDVVYCRTDGFRTTTYQDLKYGDNIGDLFYEGKENIEIVNINKVLK